MSVSSHWLHYFRLYFRVLLRLLLPAALPVLLLVALLGTTSGYYFWLHSGYYFRLHFRYYFRLHFRVLLQSENGIAMHSLCETSCPPRTVHFHKETTMNTNIHRNYLGQCWRHGLFKFHRVSLFLCLFVSFLRHQHRMHWVLIFCGYQCEPICTAVHDS